MGNMGLCFVLKFLLLTFNVLEEEKKADMGSFKVFLLTSHNTFSPRILRLLFVCCFGFGLFLKSRVDTCSHFKVLCGLELIGILLPRPFLQKLELQSYATMPGFCDIFLKNTSVSINSYPFPSNLEQQLKFLSSLLTSEKEEGK